MEFSQALAAGDAVKAGETFRTSDGSVKHPNLRKWTLRRQIRLLPMTDRKSAYFKLQHGSPTDVAKELGSVFPKPNQQNGQNAQQVNAVADPRIQAVVVTAPKEVMEQVAGLMDELDVPTGRDQKTYVTELKNGDPQQVAQVLQNMFGNNTVARNGTSSSQNSALQHVRRRPRPQ